MPTRPKDKGDIDRHAAHEVSLTSAMGKGTLVCDEGFATGHTGRVSDPRVITDDGVSCSPTAPRARLRAVVFG